MFIDEGKILDIETLWDIQRGKVMVVGQLLWDNYPRDNYPGDNYPMGNYRVGQLPP